MAGLHASRPHPGQNLVAQRLRALLNSSFYPSAISQSHANCGKVQDAYSIRCIPQVMSHLVERVSLDPSLGARNLVGYDQIRAEGHHHGDEQCNGQSPGLHQHG